MARVGNIAIPRVPAAEVGNAVLERRFAQNVRPFLSSDCIPCYDGASPAAQFDPQPYSTVAAVTPDYPRWNLVWEKLYGQADAAATGQTAIRGRPARGDRVDL
jgi:hypothetical protein